MRAAERPVRLIDRVRTDPSESAAGNLRAVPRKQRHRLRRRARVYTAIVSQPENAGSDRQQSERRRLLTRQNTLCSNVLFCFFFTNVIVDRIETATGSVWFPYRDTQFIRESDERWCGRTQRAVYTVRSARYFVLFGFGLKHIFYH